jgi:hypothetical protein
MDAKIVVGRRVSYPPNHKGLDMAAFVQYIEKTIAFTYNGEGRIIRVETVNDCSNGKVTITGKDLNKGMAYRQFDITKMSGITLIVD